MPLHRALPGAAQTGADGVLRVAVDERPDGAPEPARDCLERSLGQRETLRRVDRISGSE